MTNKLTNADHLPAKIENLGDGTYHYNFNIVHKRVTEDRQTTDTWNYNQVRLSYPVIIEQIQEKLDNKNYIHDAAKELQGFKY